MDGVNVGNNVGFNEGVNVKVGNNEGGFDLDKDGLYEGDINLEGLGDEVGIFVHACIWIRCWIFCFTPHETWDSSICSINISPVIRLFFQTRACGRI